MLYTALQFSGSMSTKRTETLLQAYRNTTSPELGDFLPAKLNSLLDTRMDPNLGHILLPTRIATLLRQASTALINALGATTELWAMPFDVNQKKSITLPHLQKIQILVLTQVHCHLSGRAVATATQNPRMPRNRRTCDGPFHAPASRLGLCLSHCCCQTAQNLHSQAYSATSASCIKPLYQTYRS